MRSTSPARDTEASFGRVDRGAPPAGAGAWRTIQRFRRDPDGLPSETLRAQARGAHPDESLAISMGCSARGRRTGSRRTWAGGSQRPRDDEAFSRMEPTLMRVLVPRAQPNAKAQLQAVGPICDSSACLH